MAYIKIDGYLCERCWHRWAPKQQGTPEPKNCPNAKARTGTNHGGRRPKATLLGGRTYPSKRQRKRCLLTSRYTTVGNPQSPTGIIWPGCEALFAGIPINDFTGNEHHGR